MSQYKCVAVSVYLLRCCPLPVFFLFYRARDKTKGKFLKRKGVLIRCNEMNPKYETMAIVTELNLGKTKQREFYGPYGSLGKKIFCEIVFKLLSSTTT